MITIQDPIQAGEQQPDDEKRRQPQKKAQETQQGRLQAIEEKNQPTADAEKQQQESNQEADIGLARVAPQVTAQDRAPNRS